MSVHFDQVVIATPSFAWSSRQLVLEQLERAGYSPTAWHFRPCQPSEIRDGASCANERTRGDDPAGQRWSHPALELVNLVRLLMLGSLRTSAPWKSRFGGAVQELRKKLVGFTGVASQSELHLFE